ncbi:glycosyl hydrolase [Rhabdochromatium marinum]|uniref:glycosyl hydrolase n=1 Tax=Rhabdochromatium marinum TaxID=48729 RepID=UPI00190861EC|nr:glycosyl hydrolase [Rhabdochromatium marinum]MBK1648680.1 glycosyl hydrolase [Rhabdochromatium marinum]
MTTTDTTPPGLMLTPGPKGAWDDARVSGPRVLRSANGLWRMWYYGRDQDFDSEINLPTGRCGLATSNDGLHWTREPGPLTKGAVFEPHPNPDRFDCAHVGISDLSYQDGLYWMWYLGGDQSRTHIGEFDAKGLQLRPGCAISRDGLHWLRLEGPHRGALLDLGAPGEPDMALCGWPVVRRFADGVWRMYYHSLDPARMVFVLCLAESSDGLRWTKRGEILGPGEPGRFDAQGIGTRDLLFHHGHWLMFYEGVGEQGYRSIGLATSDDGIHWTRRPGREPDGSAFAHAPKGSGQWDAFAVGTPHIVPLPDGSFRLYYVGANETPAGFTDELAMVQQIGVAISNGPDLTRWKRWQAQPRPQSTGT